MEDDGGCKAEEIMFIKGLTMGPFTNRSRSSVVWKRAMSRD